MLVSGVFNRYTTNKKRVLFVMSFSLLSISSFASNTQGNNKATATLSPTCVFSVNNINFGVLNLANKTANTTSSINVLCTRNTVYSLDLTYGTPHNAAYWANGRPNSALMIGQNSGDKLAYGIQVGTTFITTGSNWVAPINRTATGKQENIPLIAEYAFGYFETLRYPTPDNYSDTSTIKITY